ncbi:STAM-binding protein-like A [Dendronephthya gigantea]|uniref:STAM-binding protein-like A n=1 Tax=Dendronephthya gigantea TaxID=151771 RepID=UPI00106CDDF1|nr:STAM-binding protein-like A [Dendronephthya gigantea]
MAAITVPQNIDPASKLRNLGKLGSAVSVENDVPARRYLRSGLEMERMANIYLEEGNLEHAFILYTKLITLLVEKLPHHSQYKQITTASIADGKKRVNRAFKRAEELKEILKKRYGEELEIWKVKEAKRIQLEKEREEHARLLQQEKEHAAQQELERQKQFEQQKDEERKQSAQVAKNNLPTVMPSAPPLEVKDSGKSSNTTSKVYSSLNDDLSQVQTSEIERTIPSIDRTTKPSWLDFDSGLRTVNVPTELMRKFIDVASPNTRQNRETCGILAGKLSHHAFYISHLVIPKQTSTSDSCTTLGEEDIFTYLDAHNLNTLGWIHTHPSQTAFMSSIDLHTHCSYQQMLPEAVAIVCAPKHSQIGMYSLTREYGLKFIRACKQEGFHPHPKEPPIYEESGHIKLDANMSAIVADLR